MVSIQHVIVLDIVDMQLRAGVQGWKCTFNSKYHSRGKCQRNRGAGYIQLRCPSSPASYMATRQPVTTTDSLLGASQAINLCRRGI
jgi:hypothetical protein